MRFRARLVLGFCGLALAVPAVVMAGPLGDDEVALGAVEMQGPPPAQGEPHHHKGLFGRWHCVECQRTRVKARDGVDVPAPPPLDPGMQGPVVSSAGHCPTCQRDMVVSQPAMNHDAHAPGYAVVGGPGGPEAPGYAVVGEAMAGSEPAPVGVSKLRHGRGDGPAALGSGQPRRCRSHGPVRGSDQLAPGTASGGVTASQPPARHLAPVRPGRFQPSPPRARTARAQQACLDRVRRQSQPGRGITSLGRLRQRQPLTHAGQPRQPAIFVRWSTREPPCWRRAALG